jgi:uncharacterized protein YbjT (DUF2867 family)
MSQPLSVIMIGATGAVGGHAARTMAGMPGIGRLTVLGRRPADGLSGETIAQHVVDVMTPAAYAALLPGHQAAVCTLGVGQPSKVSKEEYVRVDKTTVLAFAGACKAAGVLHFELLCSIGADSRSKSFYLRIKGELEDGLKAFGFQRLSLFEPSMILTPGNRYGFSQGLLLSVMPLLTPLLAGGLRKYRGVPVDVLGRAMARNLITQGSGVEILRWDDFQQLAAS